VQGTCKSTLQGCRGIENEKEGHRLERAEEGHRLESYINHISIIYQSYITSYIYIYIYIDIKIPGFYKSQSFGHMSFLHYLDILSLFNDVLFSPSFLLLSAVLLLHQSITTQ
jgi:hypothetical protein